MYLLLLLALVVSVSAGTCPEVTPVDYFNFASFASGTWYEVARYPNVFEEGYECGSATYSYKNSVYYVLHSFVRDHEQIVEHGTVKIADKNSDLGVVTFSLPLGDKTSVNCESHLCTNGSVDIWRDIIRIGEKAYGAYQKYPLNILAIEYDKYYIGYYCKEGKSLGWIYSREKTLSAYSSANVEKFLRKSNILHADEFIWPQFTPMACRIDYFKSLRLLNITNVI